MYLIIKYLTFKLTQNYNSKMIVLGSSFIYTDCNDSITNEDDYFINGYSYILKLYPENIFLCVTINTVVYTTL